MLLSGLFWLAWIAVGCSGLQEDIQADPPISTPNSPPALDELVEENPAEIAALPPPAPVTGQESEPAVPSASTVDQEAPEDKEPQALLDQALNICQAAQDFWNRGDFDGAVSALDDAYALILQVQPREDPKLVQQKQDLRLTISKRLLEIYASRRTTVNGQYGAIPLILNADVEREIKSFQGRENAFFLASFKRSGRYREVIQKALEEAGLPAELLWLPLVESGFNRRALSRSRALGLWQFIPSTGYRFGLNRDNWIDERMEVQKSTAAAIAYLKELHQIFGDWMTVLAAYNCGEARVLGLIRNQKINYLDNFWDLYGRLPVETARYVPRFLATLHILKEPQKFGFDLSVVDQPLPFESVSVSKQMLLKDIAAVLEVAPEVIEDLNSQLRQSVTPPTAFDLAVPIGKAATISEKIAEIPVYEPPKITFLVHRIREGDTLSALAVRYHTTVAAIARLNGIREHTLLKLGKPLRIPIRVQVPAAPQGVPPTKKTKPVSTSVGTVPTRS